MRSLRRPDYPERVRWARPRPPEVSSFVSFDPFVHYSSSLFSTYANINLVLYCFCLIKIINVKNLIKRGHKMPDLDPGRVEPPFFYYYVDSPTKRLLLLHSLTSVSLVRLLLLVEVDVCKSVRRVRGRDVRRHDPEAGEERPRARRPRPRPRRPQLTCHLGFIVFRHRAARWRRPPGSSNAKCQMGTKQTLFYYKVKLNQ